ncbi:MAG: DUF6505 family protein [Hyphomicrobiaceae bacterium]
MIKLLRTIRFDASDTHVFDVAAEPAEWAVSGAFAFAAVTPETLVGKTRQAFANGFLGVASFGRSTFATVGEAHPEDRDTIESRLAQHFVEHYGAPGFDVALGAAREEVEFIVDLCREAPINTVFTVRRTHAPDGQIKEEFRIIRPPTAEPVHARIWTVEPD